MTDTIERPAGERSFTLEEICTLVDLPRRTVRYYIQVGLADPPEGETRAARYTQQHANQLLSVKKWAQAGLSLQRIKELRDSERQPELPIRRRRPGDVEVWSRLVLDDGIELQVEPGQAGLSPEDLRMFFRGARDVLQQIRGGKKS